MTSNKLDVRTEDADGKTIKKKVEVPEEFSYEDSLHLIGFGKVQFEILLVCGLLLINVINETLGMSIIIIASQCDFNSSSQEKAIMSVASFIGILVASYTWGYLSDTSGRRIVMLWGMSTGIFFTLISMFVSNLWVFVVLRFLTGIGNAGTSAALYAYLGEFNTQKYRPIVINYASMSVGLASVYTPAVAWLTLGQSWALSIFGLLVFRPWRLLLLFNILPGLIGVIWLWTLPESPKFYLSHGKNEEALKVLYWIYEKNTGKPSKEFEVKRLIPEVNVEFMEMLSVKKNACEMIVFMWKHMLPLFKPPLVRNYILCCIIMFGTFFISTGMGLWYPEIQNRLEFGASNVSMTICEAINQKPIAISANTVCNDDIKVKTYINSIILGVSSSFLYIILGVVINPLGRKMVLMGSLAISGLFGLALTWIYDPITVEVLLCGFIILPRLCISILNGAIVDIIPTYLRGKAVCIGLMFGRLGGVIGSNIVGAIFETYCDITFYLFPGFIIFCALLTLSLPI